MLLTLEKSISTQHFQLFHLNASIVSNKKAERRFKRSVWQNLNGTACILQFD
jgi:hypothetical protein